MPTLLRAISRRVFEWCGAGRTAVPMESCHMVPCTKTEPSTVDMTKAVQP
ncbi:hypothetical protein [Bailinhaonella thermotolerans]|nr:hypothetical protein [Bailinhaonella thermotolerans]